MRNDGEKYNDEENERSKNGSWGITLTEEKKRWKIKGRKSEEEGEEQGKN